METITYNEFLKRVSDNSFEHDVPSKGSFELTPLCNLNCKMCYVHLQDPTIKEKLLSGKQWISLIQEAIDTGIVRVLLTGGEAMTHPDFWEIYMYLIDHGVAVQLKTNGVLLNEENIQRFVKYPPFQIDVSLYGCNSESYVAVTGVDAFERVKNNIRNAIDAGLNIRLMITPSNYLYPWIEDTLKLARSFDVSVDVNSTLLEPNENTGRHKADFDISAEKYLNTLKMKDDIFLPDYHREEKVTLGKTNRPHVSEKGLYCSGGRTGFAINWDGIMVPCLAFPRNVLFSDAVQKGFRKAWQEVNSGVKNYVIPKQCHSCAYNEKCHFCPVNHKKTAYKNMCDTDECVSMKRLLDLTEIRQKKEI